eukprot:10722599-Alexandrium_andersonii.AAC.1
MKVLESAAAEVQALSGQACVFLARVREEQPKPPPINWIRRVKDESDKTYRYRAEVQAKGAGLFLAFRRGG